MPAALSKSESSVPALRFDRASGQYWTRIPKRLGGGSKWFGRDPEEAEEKYNAWAETFAESAPAPTPPTRIRTATSRKPTGTGRMAPTLPTSEVATQLFALVDSESGPAGRANIRNRLRLFLGQFGTRPIADLKAADLIAFKAGISSYSPEYRNNMLVAVRRLLRFAIDCGYAGSFPLGLLKPVPLGAVKSKGIAADKLAKLIGEVAKKNKPLARLMLVQFWTCQRPSEVPKTAWNRGEDQGGGVIAISSKTSRKTGELRAVVQIPQAVAMLAEFRKETAGRKLYQTHNAYRLACNVVGRSIGAERIRELTGKDALSPHFIRHTCCQAMLDNRVPAEHRRVMMGRLDDRVDRRYGSRRDYSATREAAAILAKLIKPSIIPK